MNTTTAEEMRAELDRLRATIERHEAAAREHAEERAGLCTELARVTGENDRLRAVLAVAQSSLEAASSGRRVTACDEVERLQRDLAEARAALREYVPRCTDCDALATRQLDGYAGWGGLRCDACAPVASQHAVEHAAALRAATVTP